MLRKLISESYWLENDQLNELCNFGFNYYSRCFLFSIVLSFIVFVYIEEDLIKHGAQGAKGSPGEPMGMGPKGGTGGL